MDTDRPNFIALCLSTIHEEDRFNLVTELNKHAVANGFRLMIFNSCSDLYDQSKADNEGSASVFRLLPYKKLAAVIIMPNIMYDPELIDEVIENCHKFSVPIISVDKEIEGCISIKFTNADIFEKLCNHVIRDHGARKLYMIAGFKNNVYSEERISAFKKALKDNGIPFEQDNLGYGCFWERPTIEVLTQWFLTEKREIPDAIICANDFMAITASSFLQNMGVRIPEDCIVTGFDGIKQTEYLPPNITTCKQDFDKMGSMLIDIISRTCNGEDVKGNFNVDFNIVYSQSCGCKEICEHDAGSSIASLLDSLRLSDERQKMLTYALNFIPRITEINYLSRMLVDKFKFNTCVFALNDRIFEPPFFGSSYRGKNSFSSNVDILYHRYGRTELPQCRIPTELLLPRYDVIMDNTDPIIVCCANFTDMVMGYCVFQPEINIDEYDKMHSLMATVGSALGSFSGRMQIKSINQKLLKANEELQTLSQRDYMTGLLNRRGFFEQLDKKLQQPEIQGSTLLFISADLDELKYINDNFGHAEGDVAIITVGKALHSSALQDDICARFGGDEFGVAVTINDLEPKVFFNNFKRRFFDYLERYNRESCKPYQVKASIGFHFDVIDADLDTDHLIRSADGMMYDFKQKHKRKR